MNYPDEPPFRSRRSQARQDEAPTGREQPHSVEAEEYLLSCCLLDGSESIAKCIFAGLQPAAFYIAANAIIYEQLVALYERRPPVAIEILAEELKVSGQLDVIGGVPYLMKVSARIPTTAQTDYFIRRVHELWVRRQLIKVGTQTVEQAFSDVELDELVERMSTDMTKVLDRRTHKEETWTQTVDAAEKAVQATIINPALDGVLSWGLPEFDNAFGRMRAGEYIVIGARPSVGKSSLLCTGVRANCRAGRSMGVFFLEDDGQAFAKRLASHESGISGTKLWEQPRDLINQFYDGLRRTRKWPLHFINGDFNVDQICARARMMHARYKLSGLYIDYLQLIAPPRRIDNREQQVAYMSRRLKLLASELGIPVIVLAQISREVDRKAREPMLSDLRESGSLEQDADRVVFVHRPSNDKDGQPQDDSDRNSYHQKLIQAKCRNGPVTSGWTIFDSKTTRFLSMDARNNSEQQGYAAPELF